MTTNRISITITDAQKSAINTKTGELATVTNGFQTVIDKNTLKSLSKIADGRIPFVEKVLQYAVTNPEFLPPYADVDEFKIDFKTFLDMRELIRPMRVVIDNMETTMQVSGSEAWDFARAYYKTVQFQAKMGVPGAQTIYDDLRPLFEAKTNPDDSGDTK